MKQLHSYHHLENLSDYFNFCCVTDFRYNFVKIYTAFVKTYLAQLSKHVRNTCNKYCTLVNLYFLRKYRIASFDRSTDWKVPCAIPPQLIAILQPKFRPRAQQLSRSTPKSGVNILRKEHPFRMGIFGVLLGKIPGF